MLLVLLILKHLLRIDIVLLRIYVTRIPKKRLLESIHSSLPVLLSDGHVTKIIIIVRCLLDLRSNLSYPLECSLRLLNILLTVEIVSQIVVRSYRKRILHKSLAVVDVRLPEVLLPEITITPAHIPPVHLTITLRYRHQQ